MPDQETLREIKRVLELTSRIDERVKHIAESHEKMADRFDKFIESHNEVVERVTKLESQNFIDRLEDMESESHAINARMTAVEGNAPYALKIVDQSLEALNKLSDRVQKMEFEHHDNSRKFKSIGGWFSWSGDMAFKLVWVVLAAWLLSRLGLSDSMLQFPF
jgi:methyl-accepting chemotaxis protein